MSTFVLCIGCGEPLNGFSPCRWCTCEWCGNDLLDGFCSLCNSRNSCDYDPNPNSFDCPPDSYHPPHPTYETYSCDSCGNDSHFGYDCQPQFPLNYEPKWGYIQNYNSYPHDSLSFPQQYLYCENREEYRDEIKIDELKENFNSISIEINKKEKLQQLEQVVNLSTYPSKRFNSFCYYNDDDEDYTIAVTPSLSTEEPDNSLSMGDEHLDTIQATRSDEFIKSSVENLIPIPKEICSGSTTTRSDISLPEYEAFYDDHVKEISSGSTTTRSDISLPEYEAFYDDHVKEISSGSTTTHSNSFLYDSFIFDLSINPFPPADRSDFYEFADELTHIISPLEYDYFFFKIEPNSRDFTMDVVEDIYPKREPKVHDVLPTHLTLQLNLEFKLSSESLFTYVVWIFLLSSYIQLLHNIFYPSGMKIPFLISAYAITIFFF
nr:pre-mRNA splicing Prp18-interacting factor [Tanacetum cinerariifolium]